MDLLSIATRYGIITFPFKKVNGINKLFLNIANLKKEDRIEAIFKTEIKFSDNYIL